MKNYQHHTSNTFNNVSIGDIKESEEGKRKRLVKCKAIYKNIETNEMFVLWQYILAKTLKPSGKSSCYLEKL